VRRSDLSRILCDHCGEKVRFHYGDSVTALAQHADRVDVSFERAPPASFDFVVGADGIHSNVRRLAFPGKCFERPLGHCIAGWSAAGLPTAKDETVCCNLPGRMLGVQPSRHGAPSVLAVFKAPRRAVSRHDEAGQRQIIRERFAGMGWRAPKLLAALEAAEDFYFNTLSRARTPVWHIGRVALVGDASGGASIGGQGSGAAIVGAFILASELLIAPEDHSAAFERYQRRVRPYAEASSSNGESAGKFMAPSNAVSLALRNAMFDFPPIKAWLIAEAKRTSVGLDLPDYSAAWNPADLPAPSRRISGPLPDIQIDGMVL
jgi:2-polyprenyl-6-methoxyphenol hydroxylase-like FAD-dependent oxidoreductase